LLRPYKGSVALEKYCKATNQPLDLCWRYDFDFANALHSELHHRPDVVNFGYPTSLASPVSATALNKGSASELLAAKDRESFKAERRRSNTAYTPKIERPII